MVLLIPHGRPDIALVDDDLYAVLSETDTLGYIMRVGSVYVALVGENPKRAFEVGQTLDWDRAIELVVSY